MITVIICSHNPRPEYLQRTLDGLRAQTSRVDLWELLLVDNVSSQSLSTAWDLSWHPRARHVREDKLGLTPARLRGIAESRGELLVFVDDDNVLAPDFLATAERIARQFPSIGAFGGNIAGEFEHEPEAWARPYVGFLAIREWPRDIWGNSKASSEMPVGAGLCVRREVAETYARAVGGDGLRAGMDRTGGSLVSGGDTDLALTACDLGLGTGVFTQLRLTHLIPSVRLTEAYLARLIYGIGYSCARLEKVGRLPRSSSSLRAFLTFVRAIFRSRAHARMEWARLRGRLAARR